MSNNKMSNNKMLNDENGKMLNDKRSKTNFQKSKMFSDKNIEIQIIDMEMRQLDFYAAHTFVT
jgi:hypothetical protein